MGGFQGEKGRGPTRAGTTGSYPKRRKPGRPAMGDSEDLLRKRVHVIMAHGGLATASRCAEWLSRHFVGAISSPNHTDFFVGDCVGFASSRRGLSLISSSLLSIYHPTSLPFHKKDHTAINGDGDEGILSW